MKNLIKLSNQLQEFLFPLFWEMVWFWKNWSYMVKSLYLTRCLKFYTRNKREKLLHTIVYYAIYNNGVFFSSSALLVSECGWYIPWSTMKVAHEVYIYIIVFITDSFIIKQYIDTSSLNDKIYKDYINLIQQDILAKNT